MEPRDAILWDAGWCPIHPLGTEGWDMDGQDIPYCDGHPLDLRCGWTDGTQSVLMDMERVLLCHHPWGTRVHGNREFLITVTVA